MTLVPSIFGENLFDTFDSDFDRMFNNAFLRNPVMGKRASHVMKTDVRETENSYELDVDLPGFKKDEVNVQLENGYLTISAGKKVDKEVKDEKGTYIRRERYDGACTRSFYVGEDIRKDDIAAKMEDGILRLTFPKKAREEIERSRTIAIE